MSDCCPCGRPWFAEFVHGGYLCLWCDAAEIVANVINTYGESVFDG